ncbi:uncharacterized protein MYCFIDRAFT_83771 [Pseudocercospora fijiensis CIRAD86]|uniref:F-box domain-containing protein n=1 Tax=Pseudocercospora fijiensis (strain CIRAD86) TaxID=383855 RepID=M3A2Y2_PSEFD|nr:uncharacterized protein MYCFIDRAFT_83771 [Pseudocercospora fijiensis CIRAD86]EME78886.1 hypothetical protein MYCFIDRAFT_83771 [Pseudocercospora fijiensis CIRAD86]
MAANPHSAGARVAGTFELLEQILRNVLERPNSSSRIIRRALVSQRVSRAFRDTIANSPHLQRELWFTMPDPPLPRHDLNPLTSWEHISLSEGTYLRVRPDDWEQVGHLVMNRVRCLPELEDASTAKHGSWRRMYLYQHAYSIDRVKYCTDLYRRDYNFCRVKSCSELEQEKTHEKTFEKKLENPTLGQLFDAVF